ncbi:Phosphatidylglycerol/phosphatidylinositol transfer protein [Apiospora rasikravindrae]|uniref:Phosphatidylglycerol/phosphatidylinositol transfer protein n=1 Tax=Apiospora rasikravindrae TaxID=990691 RepID=A0ABR1S0M6_9PEZI
MLSPPSLPFRSLPPASGCRNNNVDTLTPFHSGHYQEVQLFGNFTTTTGDVPWLNITATVNGRSRGGEPMFMLPLCDLNVFQKVSLPLPSGTGSTPAEMHRACPSDIQRGYAEISSPTLLLYPEFVPIGKWKVRAEATTLEGRRVFCVEGEFLVSI